MTRLVPLIWFSLLACGGGSSGPEPPFEPGDGDDPGTGTGTLVVDGTASARSSIINSTDPTNFTTELTVQVTRAGANVTTGTLEVRSNGGNVSLLFDATTRRWRGEQAGYFQVYLLDVASDGDAVTDVRVDGPDIHTFSAPTAGATVDSTMPLAIAWARTETAEAATVQTREINPVTISDTGTFSLAPGSLKSKPDQVEDEEIEIARSQVVTPAGGAAGSSFRVTIRTSLDVLVQPTQ